MFLLFGCDHQLAQTYSSKREPDSRSVEVHSKFKSQLSAAVSEYSPSLIAEEHHPEYLSRHGRRSVTADLASEKRICHRFCDRSPRERELHGIGCDLPFSTSAPQSCTVDLPSIRAGMPAAEIDFECYRHDIGHRFPRREEFWIKQLGEDVHKPVIFICGALHVRTLERRIKGLGVEVKVQTEWFGVPKAWFDSTESKAF